MVLPSLLCFLYEGEKSEREEIEFGEGANDGLADSEPLDIALLSCTAAYYSANHRLTTPYHPRITPFQPHLATPLHPPQLTPLNPHNGIPHRSKALAEGALTSLLPLPVR